MNPAIYKIYKDYEVRKASKRVPINELFEPNKRNIHHLIVLWRKYAAWPVLMIQIFTIVFCSHIVFGCVGFVWLTIPCGIPIINQKWYLWYLRQLYFATIAILMIFI